MKLFKYTLVFIPLLIISCTQQEVVMLEDKMPEEKFYLQDQIKPYTGMCRVYYHDSNILKEQMNYREGVLSGIHLSYYKDGSIKRKGSYSEGSLNGIWIAYDSQGNTLYEVEYQKDSLVKEISNTYTSFAINSISAIATR